MNDDPLPQTDTITGTLVCDVRPENGPQGPAGLYDYGSDDPLAHARFQQIQGGSAGLVNRTDISCGVRMLVMAAAGFEVNFGKKYLDGLYLSGVDKHTNPSGAAFGRNKIEVLQKTIEGDLQAILGGAFITNFVIGEEEANTLRTYRAKSRKLDVITAPGFTQEAIDILLRDDGAARLMVNSALGDLGLKALDRSPLRIPVRGGHIRQGNYLYVPDFDPVRNTKLKTTGTLTPQQHEDLVFADAVCRTSNSNTISLVLKGELIGNGVAQARRDRAARVALICADECEHEIKGSVGASDSFTPYSDTAQLLRSRGVDVLFSTSGSKKDEEVRAYCRESGMTSVMLPNDEARGFAKHIG